MASPAILNFTPQSLFPLISNAKLDPKCVVIAKVAEIRVRKLVREDNNIEPQQVLDDAKLRYNILSEGRRISLSQARECVSTFVDIGVSFEVAKEYVGYLVSPVYENEWRDFKSLGQNQLKA